jgi:hypothetical protein
MRRYRSDTEQDFRILEDALKAGQLGYLPDEERLLWETAPQASLLILEDVLSRNPKAFSREELKGYVQTMSALVLPTRYDSPSAFGLLDGLVKEVQGETVKLGLDLDAFPHYATVPSGMVNAMAVPLPGAGKPFLLFDGQLFLFCHLVSKIYAQCLDVTSHGETQQFSMRPELVQAKLARSPEVFNRLADVLVAVLKKGGPSSSKPFPVDVASTNMATCLRKSMEVFVVAHEFGHVYAGHLNDALAPLRAIHAASDLPQAHRQEFEADYIGLVLTLFVLGKQGYDVALSIIGVKLFFAALDLLSRYAQFLKVGHSGKFVSTPSVTHPSNQSRRAALDMGLKALNLPMEEIEKSVLLSRRMDTVTDSLWAGLVQPRTRPGRNDPCYCGSGQKVKKCCKA